MKLPFGLHLIKESAVGRLITRFNLGRAVFPGRDYANFAKEAYQLNVIAYRCISMIATAGASVCWTAYNDKGDEVDDHPVLLKLRRPNPMQSGKEFFEAAYAYDLLTGQSYIERVMVGAADLQELWTHRPDRMKIVPGQFGLPARFEYTVNGQKKEFDVDPTTGQGDILHVKRFNPLNDFYGQSPLEAMGMSVDSHNEAIRWNYSLLKNGVRPSGALEHAGPGDLDDDNFNRLKQELDENYAGSKRAGRPLLLTGGLKWVQMMLNHMEIDWSGGIDKAAGHIAIGYNIPEQLVGVKGQQTYNNYREARMAFYEDAVLPLLDRYSEALTNWLQAVPGFEGLRLGYDVDKIAALAPRREALWDKMEKAKFLTIDEKREALGYEPFDPDDKEKAGAGHVIFVSAADIPLSDTSLELLTSGLEAEQVPEEGAVDEEGNPIAADPAAQPAFDAQGKPLQGATPGAPVQDLALNGTQITAVITIVQNVVDGLMPPESAIQLLLVAFPTLDEAAANALIKPAEAFEPPKPDPVLLPPGAPAPGPGGKPPAAQPGQPGAKPPFNDPRAKHVVAVLRQLKQRTNKVERRKAYRLAYGGDLPQPAPVTNIHVKAGDTVVHTPDVNVSAPTTVAEGAVRVESPVNVKTGDTVLVNEGEGESVTEHVRDPETKELVRSVKTRKQS